MTTNIPAVQESRIKHGLLVDITVNTTTYRISNLYAPITYNGNTYTQLGHFMGTSDITDDLKATNNQITITLSGIPPDNSDPNYMSIVLNSNIKGSRVQIYRIFFDPTTYQIKDNTAYQRFNGYISNYALNENWDQDNKLVTNTISIQCSSVHAVMEKQYSGRRTNDSDQKYWYPTDTGMYRVKIISDSSFDFGKPYVAPVSTASAPSQEPA